ncbi:unnamed protein product, partial [Brenthis ino]
MTEMESSLLGSLPPLGAMAGSVLVGWIISIVGRKNGAVLIGVPMVVSWLMIDLTSSSTVILIARFLGGISGGAALVLSPIYVSEVAEESIRGALASAPMLCYCIGVLVSYILGWFLSYRYIIWTNLGFVIIYMGLLMTVTESPVFLMRQNRDEDARRSIAHYRGASLTSTVVLKEFSRLKQQINPAAELIAIDTDGKLEKEEEAEKQMLQYDNEDNLPQQKMSALKMLFVSPSSRRGFAIVCTSLTLQVLMGMVAVQVYAKDIFSKAAPSLSSHFCSVMFACILMSGCLLSAVFADKFGRKFLLVSSSIAVSLSLLGIGVLMQTSFLPPWVTAVLILFYCFAFMFGAGSVPYILIAEAFIPEVQSLASMLLMEWVWLLNFFIIGVFPFLVKFFGSHGAFYFFAVFGLLDTIFGIFMIPETKGLTNEQIQQCFLGKKK